MTTVDPPWTKKYKPFYVGNYRYCVIEESSKYVLSPGPMSYADAQDIADRANLTLSVERTKNLRKC